MLNQLSRPCKVIVIGASRGIGYEFARQFSRLDTVDSVIAGCRDATKSEALFDGYSNVKVLTVDVCNEESVEKFATRSVNDDVAPAVVIYTAGLLHDKSVRPEKRLEDIDPEAMARSFEVNAIGPALVAKHLVPHFDKTRRAVFATLSARVGSITDNRLGGWYSYRAAKSAQNMVTKNVAIEARRRAPELIVVGLHPGTVDTALSAPFQSNVQPENLFSTEQSVSYLIDVLNGLTTEDSGRVFAWDGSEVLA